MTQSAPLKSVRTCLAVIETLTRLDGCGVSELADELDMPKSTVFEYLQTLNEEGYVVKEEGVYRCSSRFLSLGERVRRNSKLYTIARPELKSLSRDTESHASLVYEENGFGTVQFIENTDHRMEPIVHLGQPTYMHSHASGKALLANLPESKTERILDRRGLVQLTENTITDREKLHEELETVRREGYAVDVGEAMEGVGGIAVPIMDREADKVVAGIALYGPASGNSIDIPEEAYLSDLMRTKNTIEVNLMRT